MRLLLECTSRWPTGECKWTLGLAIYNIPPHLSAHPSAPPSTPRFVSSSNRKILGWVLHLTPSTHRNATIARRASEPTPILRRSSQRWPLGWEKHRKSWWFTTLITAKGPQCQGWHRWGFPGYTTGRKISTRWVGRLAIVDISPCVWLLGVA